MQIVATKKFMYLKIVFPPLLPQFGRAFFSSKE